MPGRGLWVTATLGLAFLPGCDSEDVRFGPKSGSAHHPDAAVSSVDYEVDLALLGDRRHRVTAAVRGRDVRRQLPPRELTLKRGQPVFAVVPVGRSWKRVGWRAATLVSLDARHTVTVRLEEGRLFDGVPYAMLALPGRGRLKTGAVVRAHAGRALPFGLVQGQALGRITVRTVWLGEVRDVRVSRREVLPVNSGLEPAGPVVYRLGESYRRGSLVASARKYRWVLGAEGVVHRLSWDRVQAIELGRRYKAGDQVRAALPVSLKLVSVIRALDGGARYEVGWAQTRRRIVAFSALAPP